MNLQSLQLELITWLPMDTPMLLQQLPLVTLAELLLLILTALLYP
jgi:hypothetical protein